MSELVRLEPGDGFAWIRINRPEKRNAMNQVARDGLREAMERARGRYPVVALTGVDDIFCGGIDLKEVQAQALEGSQQALADWRALNVEIRAHPSVFIAAVNGIALGGGVTLTGVSDLAIAADDAAFGMPEVGFGMYPNPAGPATQLSLSRKRAAWLVLTTERISAATAVEWGLINEAVPRVDLEPRVSELASQLSRFDSATLAHSKRALDQIPLAVDDWAEAFEAGAQANARIAAAGDPAAAALARFRRGERNPGQGNGTVKTPARGD